MNVEKLIQLVKLRPNMFIGESKLEFLYYYISGFLFNNITTNRADKIDMEFKEKFHEWVRRWIETNQNIVFDEERNYLFYIQQVCQNQEQCMSLFFRLSEEFFCELHKNMLV